jgi:2-amino-4-hydroxy-6-hydroxymethyldihydropteridine diphosphokinase
MTRRIAFLSLGSNKGPREEHLHRAVHLLHNETNLFVRKFSSLYESEPIGTRARVPFVNAVCVVDTDKTPQGLLATCLELERRAGRKRRGVDRPLDIDIVLYGGLSVGEANLVIPHPRFRERLFVLVPLDEVAPDFPLPPDGRTAREIVSQERLDGWIRKISSRGRFATGGNTRYVLT